MIFISDAIDTDTLLFISFIAFGAQWLGRYFPGARFVVADDDREGRTGCIGLLHLGFEAAATAVKQDIDSLIAQPFGHSRRIRDAASP